MALKIERLEIEPGTFAVTELLSVRSNGVQIVRDEVGYMAVTPDGWCFGPGLHALCSQTLRDAREDSRESIQPCSTDCPKLDGTTRCDRIDPVN